MSINESIMKSEKMKFLNFICTSRSDYQELNHNKWKKAIFLNWLYLFIIFLVILISFIPLFYISDTSENSIMSSTTMAVLNIVVLVCLSLDYLLRWITYPIRIKNNSINPLFFFIFTSSSIMMLASISSAVLSCLVSFSPNNVDLLKTSKALSVLKIFRFILLLNIIPSFKILTEIFIRNRTIVLNLLLVIISLIFIIALIIFSIEFTVNEKISNYSDALYYSFITVTTVGFGDITCVTGEGKFLSVILGILGSIAFAIPFGIVVGAFNAKIKEKYKNMDKIDIYATTTIFEKAVVKLTGKNRFNSKVKKDSLFITLKIKYKFTKNSDLWIEILKLLGNIENIIDITNTELDDYTIINIKDKTKIKQKDLFNLLKICKIDFHMQN